MPSQCLIFLALFPLQPKPASSDHWAFQPVRDATPPALRTPHSTLRTPLDRFILAKLDEKGLRPGPPADKRTLIRRATFDLTGLPPTPEEIDAFLKDESPSAFAKAIDRLLASPHYGERWGRHWLDVARYADSNGMDENLVQANAWRYRDYVIRGFNADKPFDQFIREQIAGDLLGNPAPFESVVATGFLTLGPKMLAEDDPVKMEMDIVDEQVDTVGKAFLGLTLGCARCHDHKFDPLSQADYYGLAGIFKSTKTMDNFKVVARWHERALVPKTEADRWQAHQQKVGAAKQRLATLTKAAGVQFLATWFSADLGEPALKKLRDEVAALEKAMAAPPEAMAVEDGASTDLRIHLRGNHLTLGANSPRRFPVVLTGNKQSAIDAKQSGRRQLADWIASPNNPLTARVVVNRVWHWHFGSGLVRSTDNFGRLGDRPSHPELLDWLASRLVADGWSLKALHRRIMLSATYQQSAGNSEFGIRNSESKNWFSIPHSAFRIPHLEDPDNRLCGHFDRRRLDAESLRDALLAVGGNLDRTMGGSLMQGGNRGYVPGYPNGIYEKYDFPRRSVYLPVIRSMLYDVFQAFDFADPSTPAGERASTTIAPQALFMLNGKLMQEQSRRFAASLLAAPGEDAGRIKLAYERAYGRPPTSAETNRALVFVNQVAALPGGTRDKAWQSLARVILSANEFVYVE